MKPLPEAEGYEQELKFWPYRASLQWVTHFVKEHAPKEARVLDLMCGPGYLLGKIQEVRPDLQLHGADIDSEFIHYALLKYQGITFGVNDVLNWKNRGKFEVVLCTGALHHLPYDKQPEFIASLRDTTEEKGFALVSDCYVDDYFNEKERMLAAARLGYEYLAETIRNGAPKEVIAPCIDVIMNDVMMDEFKTSVAKREPVFRKHFKQVQRNKTWPMQDTQYGDYQHVLRK